MTTKSGLVLANISSTLKKAWLPYWSASFCAREGLISVTAIKFAWALSNAEAS